MDEVSVERSVTVATVTEEVWESIIDGTVASEWMGSPIVIDPRPGGAVEFAPDGVPYIGTVEEVEEGRSITWSWRHPHRDPSQVTIAVEPSEEGTTITVIERLLPYTITDTRDLWPRAEHRRGLPVVLLAA